MKGMFVTILALCALAGASPLSLHDAQQQLFANNLDLMVAGQQVNIARLGVSEASASLQPSLDFFTNYNYTTRKPKTLLDVPAGTISPAQTLPIERELEINMQDRTELGLDLSYPLFTGFTRINARKAKQFGLAQQQASLDALKNQLSLRLSLLYFRWDLSLKQCLVQDALVKQLAALAEQRASQFAGGTIARAALLDAQARQQTAVVELMTSQDQADSLKNEVLNLIQSSDTSLAPQAFEPPSFDSSAGLNPARAELVALDKADAQLSATKNILWGSRLPMLAGKAGYHYGRPGINNGINKFMDYGVAGLALTWNLYDGMKTQAQRSQMEAQIEMVQKQKAMLVDQFNNRISAAQRSLKTSRRQLTAAQSSQQAAAALAEDLKNASNAGTATSFDYLSALTNLGLAQQKVELCKCQVNIAIVQLLYAQGKNLEF